MPRISSEWLPKGRSLDNLAADISAVRAIAQAALNVELFTVPLYQTALYSIEGMHAVTGAGSDLYKGRLWPGMKTAAKPETANQHAFNIVFSVFIQEMLHMQLAANMATAIGVKPTFTALQTRDSAWTCYGPDKTAIPYIVDLTQTSNFTNVKVATGALDEDRIELFLAIEQPEEQARAGLGDNAKYYFPKVPFEGWKPEYTDANLPMFGTIGWMYQCYHDYLHLEYEGGTKLWDHVYNPNGVQNDLFNNFAAGHPMREFPGFETTVALTYSDIAFRQVMRMMDAITDQGEGSTLKTDLKDGVLRTVNLSADNDMLKEVRRRYRPSRSALDSDYPSYSDTGKLEPSADGAARANADGYDHYERFLIVRDLLPQVTTWAQSKKPGHWETKDLQPDAAINPPYDIPSAEAVAKALNNLKGDKANLVTLSQAVNGCIAGVTTVLNSYWNPPEGGAAPGFPFPSMSGTGPRVALCWAVFGEGPDLAQGVPGPIKGLVYHACQSLDSETPGVNSCAQPAVFHNCRGSNKCAGQGGCGYVQPVGSSGGGCGSSGAKTGPFNAPSDNYCGGAGGCAAPISASQLFPEGGMMELYALTPFAHGCNSPSSQKIGEMEFKLGQRVDDAAYQAFKQVMEHQNKAVPPAPATPNDLRLAFPPTT